MKRFLKRFFLTLGVLIVLGGAYVFTMMRLNKAALEMKGYYVSSYNTSAPVLLPSLFINGQRFYIKMASVAGDTLLAYGDSGGGISMLPPATIDKLKLKSAVKMGLCMGLMPMSYILFGDVVSDKSIPPPMPSHHLFMRHPFARVTEPFFFMPRPDEEMKFIATRMVYDAFLGQNFFMGKAWTFDYINRQVWVNTPLPETEAGKPGVQKIGFKTNANGEKIFGHASMAMEVDGEIIDMLFDTGATIILSEEGKKMLNTSEKTLGGSFIAKSVFEKWRKLHPDWKYYPKADGRQDIIEVPSIKISGSDVGPVLFAERPDEAWSQGMINSMDKVVKGAIGGSALQYFKVTVDYNSSLIKFEKQQEQAAPAIIAIK